MDWCSAEFAALVGGVCRTEQPAILLVQFTFMAKCFDAVESDGPLRVLDADNLFSFRPQRYEEAGIEYSWIAATPEEEAEAVRKAELVLAIQEQEMTVLRTMAPAAQVVLFPPLAAARRSDGCDSHELLAVSNAYDAQIAGMQAFVEHALPRIRRRHPDAVLTVVGRLGDALPATDGLVCVGVQEHLDMYYDRAAIIVNPLLAGTGMKVKTAYALCNGKCLVSSPAGVQGLEAYRDIYRIAGTPAEFAAVIGDLLDRPDEIAALARRAYDFARSYFDPKTRFETFQSAVAELLAARGSY
jgi:hypothetical protein